MLYKMCENTRLESIPYLSFSALKKMEKDLENLLADNLLSVFFEGAPLMPIFQERSYQNEADLYALNEAGDLVIFELKRGQAGSDAVLQILRYTQDAGQWTFAQLETRFEKYSKGTDNENKSLVLAHKEAFQLEHELHTSQFNTNQHLWVVGNAANTDMINAIDYWKSKGLPIDFIPYRVFEISGCMYFEFFSKPYDIHRNAGERKGVLFDTNRSYDENSIWEMFEKKRVSAYGKVSYFADYVHPKDIIIYSHRYDGIVAAAEVIGPVKNDGPEEKYHDVRFLTPIPTRKEGITKAMPFSKVSEITRKTFFWARTIKVPYLTADEAGKIVKELNAYLL